MRSEFEKHYLSLAFHTEGSAQLCLDSCTFDEKQDAYLPNMYWILENDEDECVVYCCMLNTAYISFKHQQSKVDELQLKLSEESRILHNVIDIEYKKREELQKRVDAVKQEVCVFANFIKRFDEHTDTATIMGTLDGFIEGLEQALKGEQQ